MRVLVIDTENMMLDFVLRCTEAGHDVRWFKYPDNGKITRDGEGFKGFKIVDDWKASMPWARDGLILVSGNFKYMWEIDRFREMGYKVFGPTVKSAELEIKRSVGLDAMKAVGIEVPSYHTFDSLEDAAAFARKSDRAWVHKPMGDESDKSLTYVSSDPADMVGFLQRRIKAGVKLRGPVMLQEKIDMIAEVGVSGWFGPDGFLPDKWQIAFEHKKLHDGEIGPATGEQGTVCQYLQSDKLAEETLVPMAPVLRVLGHTGDFAINAGIDAKGNIHPFEWTVRFGYPAFFLQIASHKGDPAKWMLDLLQCHDSLSVSLETCVGVVCAQPMYPYGKSPPELVEGNPIDIEDEGELDNVHMCSVMVGRGPKMVDGKIVDRPIFLTSGEYVAVCTGLGKTIEKARKSVYRTVKAVDFANKIYRTDIGLKLGKSLSTLHKLGFAKGVEFD